MSADNVGAVRIDVPGHRNGTFGPQLVKKRQSCLRDMGAMVLSLSTKGLTSGQVAAHFAEVCGTGVSKDLISRVSDRVVDEMIPWTAPPLGAGPRCHLHRRDLVIKARDGQVRIGPATPRSVPSSTDAIESLNARFCGAVRARALVPTEQVAFKSPAPV